MECDMIAMKVIEQMCADWWTERSGRAGGGVTHPWAAERAGGETRGRAADGSWPVRTQTIKHTVRRRLQLRGDRKWEQGADEHTQL